jgi:hypothetical protein
MVPLIKDRAISLAILGMALFLSTALSISVAGKIWTWLVADNAPSFIVTDFRLGATPTVKSHSIKMSQTVTVTKACTGNLQVIVDDADGTPVQRETFPALNLQPGTHTRQVEFGLQETLRPGKYRLEVNRISFCQNPDGYGLKVEVAPFPIIEFEVAL